MLDADEVRTLIHENCERHWAASGAEPLHPASAHLTVDVYVAAVTKAGIATTEARLVRAIMGEWTPGGAWRHPKPEVVLDRLRR